MKLLAPTLMVAASITPAVLLAQASARSLADTTDYIANTVAFKGSVAFGDEVFERLVFSANECAVEIAATVREGDSFVVGTISFDARDLFAELVEVDDDDTRSGIIEIELPRNAGAPDPTVGYFAPVGSRSYDRLVAEIQSAPEMGTCDAQGCTISITVADRTLPLLTPTAVDAGDEVVAALRQMNTLCMEDAANTAASE